MRMERLFVRNKFVLIFRMKGFIGQMPDEAFIIFVCLVISLGL